MKVSFTIISNRINLHGHKILYLSISVTEKIILNTEISSIIDRLDSPRKNKVEEEILIPVHQPIEIVTNDSVVLTVANHTDFIEEMQINVETMPQEMVTTSVPVAAAMPDVNKYRQMIPYNTTDPEKISQQETILDLLITNDICDDETFKIFIAEPDAHKDQASKILDSLYCVNTMIPDTYENEMAPEWMDTIQSAPILIDPTTTIETPEHVEGTASELESIVTTGKYSFIFYSQSRKLKIIFSFPFFQMCPPTKQLKLKRVQMKQVCFRYLIKILMQMHKRQYQPNSHHYRNRQKIGIPLAISNIKLMLVRRRSVYDNVRNAICNIVYMSPKMNYSI